MAVRVSTLTVLAAIGMACAGGTAASSPRVESKPHNGSIVYASQRVAGQVNRLYVMDANGAHQRPLGTVRDVSDLAWSPDSRWLVFAMGHNCWPYGDALYLMRADGTHLRRLTHDRACYAHPTWAPGGTRIAYASRGRIWVMRRNGTGRRPLTTAGDEPAWSPDGQTIAFRSGDPEVIWLMDSGGGDKRQLTTFRGQNGGDLAPSWSPNGKWLAFDRAHSLSGVWHFDIYKIRPNGTGFRQLTDRRGYLNRMPAWSPDGTRIVFVSDRLRRHEREDVYVMRADGTQQIPLTSSGIDNQSPAWQAQR